MAILQKSGMCLAAWLLALAILGCADARTLLQSTTQNITWAIPSSGHINPVSVPVGGTVNFVWQSQHSVYEIPSNACPPSFTDANVIEIAGIARDGHANVTFPARGVRYFACSVPTHCSRGQLVAIYAGVPAPAPSPGPVSG